MTFTLRLNHTLFPILDLVFIPNHELKGIIDEDFPLPTCSFIKYDF